MSNTNICERYACSSRSLKSTGVPFICGFFSFAIAKATRQVASNPKVSSDTNHRQCSTARSWAQIIYNVVLLDVCGMDSKASLQNRRFHRTIDRHFGETEKLQFLYIICYYEVDPKSTYDSRWVIFFKIITANFEACICELMNNSFTK